MSIKSYQKKFNVVKALQWTEDNTEEVLEFIGDKGFISNMPYFENGPILVINECGEITYGFYGYFIMEEEPGQFIAVHPETFLKLHSIVES